VSYVDRIDAGRALVDALGRYARAPDAVVVGLARGGVVVASVVADGLELPFDVLVVRKLGLPWAPEVAFGAVAGGGVEVRDPALAGLLPPGVGDRVARRERTELDRREQLYRGGAADVPVGGRTVILVDDGLATGASARAAIAAVRAAGARRVVLAVPVGARDALAMLGPPAGGSHRPPVAARARRAGTSADEVVCPLTPHYFGAVSAFYRHFDQVSDAEVIAIMTAR
jgi:predicted phosphoribosyltransferase